MSLPVDQTGSALAQLVAKITVEAPPSLVDSLIETLNDHQGPISPTLTWSLERVAANAQMRTWAREISDQLSQNPNVTPASIALALAASRATIEREPLKIELVWTGPDNSDTTLRRTDQVLLGLIESAQSELLIVSFAVYQELRWSSAIGEALNRGVKVTFVIETEASGKIEFQGLRALGNNYLAKCRILTWDVARRPTSGAGTIGTLHAKCAVADRHSALISSANLTAHAMEMNMEIGIGVTGGAIPGRIAQIFDDLISRTELVPASLTVGDRHRWKNIEESQ